MTLAAGDALTTELLALLAHVATPLGADAETLRAQAAAATVRSWSGTVIDLEVGQGAVPLGVEDGPIPGWAMVHAGGEVTGEILVWVRDGRLTGLEQAWYGEDRPGSWPTPDAVEVIWPPAPRSGAGTLVAISG